MSSITGEKGMLANVFIAHVFFHIWRDHPSDYVSFHCIRSIMKSLEGDEIMIPYESGQGIPCQ